MDKKDKENELLDFLLNPFPKIQFWDHPKFKEAADDNWNVAIKGF